MCSGTEELGKVQRTCLGILIFWSPLSKKTLDEPSSLFLVYLRAHFQKHLTNLCHAATFRRSNCFQTFLKI